MQAVPTRAVGASCVGAIAGADKPWKAPVGNSDAGLPTVSMKGKTHQGKLQKSNGFVKDRPIINPMTLPMNLNMPRAIPASGPVFVPVAPSAPQGASAAQLVTPASMPLPAAVPAAVPAQVSIPGQVSVPGQVTASGQAVVPGQIPFPRQVGTQQMGVPGQVTVAGQTALAGQGAVAGQVVTGQAVTGQAVTAQAVAGPASLVGQAAVTSQVAVPGQVAVPLQAAVAGRVLVPGQKPLTNQAALPGAVGAIQTQAPMSQSLPIPAQMMGAAPLSGQIAVAGPAPLVAPLSMPMDTLGVTAPVSMAQASSGMNSVGVNTSTVPPQSLSLHAVPGPNGQLDLSHLPSALRVAAVEYDVFLSELAFNSKEIINNLTRVAHENLGSSVAIGTVIIQRILTSLPDRKLPLLYLTDSICKNIGQPYVSLFAPVISRAFLDAYQTAGQLVRASMHRLLNTWSGVFSTSLVDSVRRACIPLDARPASTIHINPAIVRTAVPIVPRPVSQSNLSTIASSGPVQNGTPGNTLDGISGRIPVGAPGPVARTQLEAELERVVSSITVKGRQGIPPTSAELGTLSSLLTTQLQTAAPVDRQRLLALQAQVAALSAPAKARGPQAAQASVPGMPTPVLNYPTNWSDLKSEGYRLVVQSLYEDLKFVSKADGMRFATLEDLRSHMDWVFKQNRRKRARVAGSVSRCWYDAFDAFLKPEESAGFGQPKTGAEYGRQHASDEKKSDTADKVEEPRVPASGEGDEKCPTCLEKFESVWDDERQSWMLREAKQVEGVAYHVKCAPGSTPRTPLRPNDRGVKREREKEDEEEKQEQQSVESEVKKKKTTP